MVAWLVGSCLVGWLVGWLVGSFVRSFVRSSVRPSVRPSDGRLVGRSVGRLVWCVDMLSCLISLLYPVYQSQIMPILSAFSITGAFRPYHGAKSNYLRWLQPVPCRRTADGTSLLCIYVSSSSNIFWLQTVWLQRFHKLKT